MIQAGAVDPNARKMQFDDSLMGQLVRFVSSHEVGHTLGLMHNFRSSSMVPVDSLRNKKWVEANGHTPSIMDYARFNYVAQPEDSISEKGIFARIGPYDDWAIEWGYKWLPDLKTDQEEQAYMNKLVIDRVGKDKRLQYGAQGSGDPRDNSEVVGDNPMKAGAYGIKNLKRILPQLSDWTKEPNQTYLNLYYMQRVVLNQFVVYLGRVTVQIGGITRDIRTVEEKGNGMGFNSREWQKEAVQFLQDQLFTTPKWIVNKENFLKVGGDGVFGPMSVQRYILNAVMDHRKVVNLLFMESIYPGEAYTFNELLNDLETGIWRELRAKKPIDIYRRNLQKLYVTRLIDLSTPEKLETPGDILFGPVLINTDYFSILKAHARKLIAEINKTLPGYNDEMSRAHLIDVKDRLTKLLKDKSGIMGDGSGTGNAFQFNNLFKENQVAEIGEEKRRQLGCWEMENFFNEVENVPNSKDGKLEHR